MKVTADMPKEEGGTVQEHGALLDLADFIDIDGQGVKVAEALDSDWQPCVKLTVDSFGYPGKSAYLNPQDAADLGYLLIVKAGEVRVSERRS